MNDMPVEVRIYLFHNGEKVRKILLSDRERKIVSLCFKKGGILSHDLAKEYNISLANAGGTLSRIHNKGWLVREQIPDLTRGIQYIYRTIRFR